MSNYATLKAAVQAVVKSNGNKDITGTNMQSTLLGIINSLGSGYLFKGVATPSTNPGTPDEKVYYIANQAGVYSNFTGLELKGDSLGVFVYDSSWHGYALPYSMMQGELASCDLNTVMDAGTWLLISSQTYTNSPATTGFFRVSRLKTGSRYYILQEFFSLSGTASWIRGFRDNSTPGDWQPVKDGNIMRMQGILGSTDLNNLTTTGTWLLASPNEYTNAPNNAQTGFLRVSKMETNSGSWILQEYYTLSANHLYARRFRVGQTPNAWSEISGGSGGGDITNNYTFNSYTDENTFNVSPIITTDTNNFLASTGDDTDRTADIVAMLSQTGICRLGPGKFVIGNLIMPASSELVGSGPSTRVVLSSSVTDGFAIKPNSRCIVKDFRLLGSSTQLTVSLNVGTRHGILWQGDYTQSQSAPQACIVQNLIIENFEGGAITCYDTGYGTYDFVNATSINIRNCNAAINISYWSEFHKFTNIKAYACGYGCINNGGNNVFVNCDFSSNMECFLMDNSQSQSPNNSHGSCVGCVFNHAGNNTGVSIRILNCDNGYIFTGCQIFYGKIVIEDSEGIVISDSNFGKENSNISISGGATVLFANNIFQQAPPVSIVNNDKVHFVNCYERTTGAAVGN